MSSGLQILNPYNSSVFDFSTLILPKISPSAVPGSISYDPTSNVIQVQDISGTTGIIGDGINSINNIVSQYMTTQLLFQQKPDFTVEVSLGVATNSIFKLYFPNASTTSRGIMSIGSQTIAGHKTFSDSIKQANLINSVIIDTSNTVVADNLATTGSPVVIKTASPPSGSGKVLTATSPTSATWQTAPSGGIYSLNGQTHATQNFATGTSGNTFNIVSSGGLFSSTHTFNIPNAGVAADGFVSIGSQTFGGNKTFSGDTSFSGVVSSTITNITNTVTADILKSATTQINVSLSTPPVPGQYLTANNGTSAIWKNPTSQLTSVLNTSNATIDVSTGFSGQQNYVLIQNSGTTATWQHLTNNSLRTPTSQNYYLTQNKDIGNISYTTGSGNAEVFLSSMGTQYSSQIFDPFSMLSLTVGPNNFSQAIINNGGGPTTVNIRASFVTAIYSNTVIDQNATYQIALYQDGVGVAVLGLVNAPDLFDTAGNSIRVNLSGWHEGNYDCTVPHTFEIVMVVSGADPQPHSFQLQQTNIEYTILPQ